MLEIFVLLFIFSQFIYFSVNFKYFILFLQFYNILRKNIFFFMDGKKFL